MANDIKSNVVDQPAEANGDKLGMNAYAAALTEFISNAQSPLTIALQGEWGSGKTSLMKALETKLACTDEKGKPTKDAPFFGVWINTWQYALMSNPDEAIVKILASIIGNVSTFAKTSKEDRVRLLCKLARVGGGVVSDLFKKVSGVDLEKGIKTWVDSGDIPPQSSVEDLKEELADRVKKAIDATAPDKKRGFLFFIDDLDRIDPPVAVQILELLKNIFDLENCIFVLAIDYGVVVKGLKPKFGEMKADNEREFRSFFDKIIQLPFAMPVNSYEIDGFLMESLANIGYLDATEAQDKTLCAALTDYAIDSVGTNPRSLKRLINYLSLIRLLIGVTKDKQDDADFAAWKDVLFALVSLQIQYPKIYDALLVEPDFPNWGETFEQKMRLEALKDDEKEKLKKMKEFDEAWEQILLRLCRRDKDAFLEAHAPNISRILNRIKARIAAVNPVEDGRGDVGETVEWLMRLSAVTNVKSEPSQIAAPIDFNHSEYLHGLCEWTLGMTWPADCWQADLGEHLSITSVNKQLKKRLKCTLWRSGIDGITDNDNFLCWLKFEPFHDGESFQLKIWGEFYGRTSENDASMGVDFGSHMDDVIAAENAYRAAWRSFGTDANIGHNVGEGIGWDDIWWNVFVPFKDYDELVSDDFSQKLRKALSGVANAFASLLKYRVPANQ